MQREPETKRLSPAYAFKLSTIEAAGQFAGYASTFGGPPDSYGDVIAPGAFARALGEHRERGSLPAMLWQHDSAAPIGRWCKLQEDGRGLVVEGRLTLEVQKAREAYALLRDGALNGLSIGFQTRRSEVGKHGGRLLTDVALLEISLVTLPANASARVAAVKTSDRIETIRQLETALRDELGFSHRAAKRLASGGWPALAERDVPGGATDEMADALRRAADRLTAYTERMSRNGAQ